MNPADLLRRCQTAFGDAPPDQILKRARAIVLNPSAFPNTSEGNFAIAGLEALKNGELPNPEQLSALLLLVRLTRPAPLVRQGRPADLSEKPTNPKDTPLWSYDKVFPAWSAFQSEIGDSLKLVGRIDRKTASIGSGETIGTGLLLAPDRLLTNRHVLSELSLGANNLQLGQAIVRLDFEYGSYDPAPNLDITGVIDRHPQLDAVLLRVEPLPSVPSSFPQFNSKALVENDFVVVVGYPMNDSARNPLFINQIFENKFGVLRAAPGQCTGIEPQGFFHDCSTLGGNSGSPIFTMTDGSLVGMHCSGGFLWQNQAIGGAALAAFAND